MPRIEYQLCRESKEEIIPRCLSCIGAGNCFLMEHHSGGLPRAVFFDRDGTLIRDVPYNGDPSLVTPLPGAREAVAAVRRCGLPVGVVTNQSGVGRGLLSRQQVDAVNARVTELLGPFDLWCICPHAPEAGCSCRKPAPGMLLQAARHLGFRPTDLALIGDIGADMEAAAAAGARGVLVPTSVTRQAEIDAAPEMAATIGEAVALLLQPDRLHHPAVLR